MGSMDLIWLGSALVERRKHGLSRALAHWETLQGGGAHALTGPVSGDQKISICTRDEG